MISQKKLGKEVRFACNKYQIPIVVFGSIEENSHAIGKKNRAIIGICDDGLSKRFLELINN